MKSLAAFRMLVFGATLAFMSSLGASSASATSFTLNFTSDHCTGDCLTGQTSGGTVTVTDNGTGTLTFDVELANGNQFINSGFEASFGFNLSGIASVTYSGITPAASFTIPGGNPQASGSQHMDGTGFFTYGLDGVGNGASDPLGSSLMFTIAAAGLDYTDFVPNAAGQLFAADVLSGTTGLTGGIDASGTLTPTPTGTGVPDGGSTVTLLGSALLGLGLLRRRFGNS